MALDDIRDERLKKISLLEAAGMNPYPTSTARTHTLLAVREQFAHFESTAAPLVVAGRVLGKRGQGGIMFVDLYDGEGEIQALVRRDDMTDAAFELFTNTVDSGDIIEVSGTALTSKRGEPSIAATAWRMLAKSVRALPSEWYGLKDDDERYRRRYVDMILNRDVIDRIKKRSLFWNTIRAYLLERSFTEVETPVLETTPGGAEARPFVTHHNALDMDVYLRICGGELWQKRLLVGGLTRTFEIGRIFRNEGMSFEHAQDYTQLEFYAAYMDDSTGIDLIADLYRTAAHKVFGTTVFTSNGHTYDLAAPWERKTFSSCIEERYGFDPRDTTLEAVRSIAAAHNIPVDPKADVGRIVDLLWKSIRKTIAGPLVLTDYPAYLEPLAKRSEGDARTVERFQIIIGGTELGKAFNELNDPIDQGERLTAQQALRDAGDDEAQMNDIDYVEALEYGMPPAFGFGVSERLFAYLCGVPIREAQAFPLMKPRQ